jgi:dsDNA-binding SOS-regulon protein
MAIELKFCTSDGEMHDTRKEANAHQNTLDARGMLENLIAQLFSAHGQDDDPGRDSDIAAMLYTNKDDVISLLRGKPVASPDIDPAALEDAVEHAAALEEARLAQVEQDQQDDDDRGTISGDDIPNVA